MTNDQITWPEPSPWIMAVVEEQLEQVLLEIEAEEAARYEGNMTRRLALFAVQLLFGFGFIASIVAAMWLYYGYTGQLIDFG